MSFRDSLNALFGVSLRVIGLIFGMRLIRDTGARMVLPFIPQISAGLGLTIIVFSWLIFIQAMVGMVGPIFGMLSDRYGRRKIMALGLFCQGVGALGLAASRQVWAGLPMLVLGLGLAIFIPVQQAYISDQVAYQKRGRALAAIEFSWALVAILILPVVGWLMARFGWRTPFLALAPFAFLGAILTWWGLPRVEHHTRAGLSWIQVRTVCFRPNVLAAMVVSWLIFVALSSFFSLWGIWLTGDFGLDAAALGLVATAVGITELGGSVSSSLFIDRLGKKRGAGLGLFLATIIFLLLPLSQGRFAWAIGGLVSLGLLLEFTIVSLIPLYSEQAPEARGTVLSLMALGSAMGLAIGPPLTATLWQQFGLAAVSGIAAGCVFVALGIMGKFLREA
ncbi:MAG: MFS transporter [Anaerolineae bacterium]|nr:MFS transporter [Anaerolineae bacterium]